MCDDCGQYMDGWTNDQIADHTDAHMDSGGIGGWHSEDITQTYQIPAETHTVHHDAVTHTVHHDATGHNEQVVSGYKCSCGATK